MKLEQRPLRSDIWQARAAHAPRSDLSTGFATLDEALGLRGWPQGATTELLANTTGMGELRLLLPTLAQLSQAPKWLTWISPPYLPYAPALVAAGINTSRILLVQPQTRQHSLWATQQALKSGCCNAVLSWQMNNHIADKDLRRLQLAAKQGNCWHVQFRPLAAQYQASPAALRMALRSTHCNLVIDIIKQRQHWGGQQVHLPFPETLPAPGVPGISLQTATLWQ